MTKVDIISGFLGAGKTTLIRKLVSDLYENEKVMLIENEFGVAGIDSAFLEDTGLEITEIKAGCICCTLAGEFSDALEMAVEKFTPDRIIIEPTGVAKLSDVISAVDRCECVEAGRTVTVLDVRHAQEYRESFGEFFEDQIVNADSVYLSHVDCADEHEVEHCREMIHQLKDHEEHHHEQEHHHHEHHHHDHDHHDHEHHHHHADNIFESISVSTAAGYDKSLLRDAAEKLAREDKYGKVIRAKGILKDKEGGSLQLDYAGGDVDVRKSDRPVETGSIDIIGCNLNRTEIQKIFN